MAAASLTFREDTILREAFSSSGYHTFSQHFPWYVLSLRVGAYVRDVLVRSGLHNVSCSLHFDQSWSHILR